MLARGLGQPMNQHVSRLELEVRTCSVTDVW
jgi:hypothetical protein